MSVAANSSTRRPGSGQSCGWSPRQAPRRPARPVGRATPRPARVAVGRSPVPPAATRPTPTCTPHATSSVLPPDRRPTARAVTRRWQGPSGAARVNHSGALHERHRESSSFGARRTSSERERRLPPWRVGAHLDPVDPLHPPEAPPARGDDPGGEAVAGRQRLAADARGHQQVPALGQRESPPVAGGRGDQHAPPPGGRARFPGSLGWQQAVQPSALPVLLGVPAAGAVDGGPQPVRKGGQLRVRPVALLPAGLHPQPPAVGLQFRHGIVEPLRHRHGRRVEGPIPVASATATSTASPSPTALPRRGGRLARARRAITDFHGPSRSSARPAAACAPTTQRAQPVPTPKASPPVPSASSSPPSRARLVRRPALIRARLSHLRVVVGAVPVVVVGAVVVAGAVVLGTGAVVGGGWKPGVGAGRRTPVEGSTVSCCCGNRLAIGLPWASRGSSASKS